MSRQRGVWVNFGDRSSGVNVIPMHSGTISTCVTPMFSTPVITNGKIGSISDLVTIAPQNPPVPPERGQE